MGLAVKADDFCNGSKCDLAGRAPLGAKRPSGLKREAERGQEEKCDLTARRSAIEGFYLPQVF